MQSTGGKTRKWQFRRRCDNNIKICLKEIGWDCVYCIMCLMLGEQACDISDAVK
jgi:hypothetical protein